MKYLSFTKICKNSLAFHAKGNRNNVEEPLCVQLGRLFIPVSFVGLVGEFRENRRGQVTGEAAMFTAYTSSIVESQPASRGKGNK